MGALVSDQLLTIYLNSKHGGELPFLTNVDNTDTIIVFDTETGLVSQILKSDLIPESSANKSSKYELIIDSDGQTNFNLGSRPDNIDLIVNRGYLIQDIDYTYNITTGALVTTNGIELLSKAIIREYQNTFSKKQTLTITSANQISFTIPEKPNNIDLILNRGYLIEGTDYTYDNTTGIITIINQYYIDRITLTSILEARKIF